MAIKKNILLLFADEHAAPAMGAYGNERIITPNMDALAKEGILFERAYVTQPVCTPSRSSILTGLYPFHTGAVSNNVPMRRNVKCINEYMDGYKSAYVGKWHLGDEIFRQHGFDEWVSVDDGYRKYYGEGRDKNARSDYFRYLLSRGYTPDATDTNGGKSFSRDFCIALPEEDCKAAFVGRETCRILRECAKENKPFVLCANFFEPHMPYGGPLEDKYALDSIPLPDNFNDRPGSDRPRRERMIEETYRIGGFENKPLETSDDWKRFIRRYYSMVTQIDNQIGAIMNTLRETGVYDDTIIVYTSDHGDMMGSHGMLAKCVMYEEAIRVPLLISAPGYRRGGVRIAGPVGQADLMPTLLDLAGHKAPADIDGQSLLPILQQEAKPERDVVVIWDSVETGVESVFRRMDKLGLEGSFSEEERIKVCRAPARTILTKDGWKYTLYAGELPVLTDLNNDPAERTNLAGKPEYAKLERKLREALNIWQRQIKDPTAI